MGTVWRSGGVLEYGLPLRRPRTDQTGQTYTQTVGVNLTHVDFNVRQLFHIIGIDEFGRAKENGGHEAVRHGQGNRLVPRTVSKVADAHLNGAAKCAADAR